MSSKIPHASSKNADGRCDALGMDVASYCSMGIAVHSIFGSLIDQVLYYLFTHEKINM